MAAPGATAGTAVVDGRLLASGDEAGSAPGDRKFRPDVEGLRAAAVLLVVLYHAGVPLLTGGYVGVDVFFVISGFVITGLLLRERQGTGTTSILGFYARRVRRILPAATLVILATVVAAFVVLEVVSGDSAASDGRWAAVFLANFHFAWVGTNYLTAGSHLSPLQNYWSLSVEEQFYVVYPTLFLLVATLGGRTSLRTRLSVTLGVVIVASYWLSVVQTASHPTAAYFSPFTRAWELALGGLVAVSTTWLRRLPTGAASALTWAGLAAVLYSAFAFTSHTAYPGSLVAVPVVGAALVIAGGVAVPRWGAESILGLGPSLWLGRRSYSLYLWHWPLLVIAAERVGKSSLSTAGNLMLVAMAMALSMVTYRLVERPIRHWRLPMRTSVLAGVTLVVATVLVLSFAIAANSVPVAEPRVAPAVDEQVVLGQVAAAAAITRVPGSVRRAGFGAASYVPGFNSCSTCYAGFTQMDEQVHTLGDIHSSRLMVVYGDSHALMWTPAFAAIATADHWRLVVLGKLGCPATRIAIRPSPGWGVGDATYPSCDAWHTWATDWIDRHRPDLLVFSQYDAYAAPGPAGSPVRAITGPRWTRGLEDLFASFRVPNMRMVLLGTTPTPAHADPTCLAAHTDDVQHCSSPTGAAMPPLDTFDRAAAFAAHIGYVDTVPWFCSRSCTPIIGNLVVYYPTGDHISAPYAGYLQNAVAQALGLPPPHA